MSSALSIRNLRKVYSGGFEALKGIDLEVEQGQFLALLGPNGAGKSTTIGIISGLVNKSSGTIEVFGRDIDRDFSGAKREIGVVPQEFNFNQFERVADIVETQAGMYGLPRKLAAQRTETYLHLLELWDKRNEQSRFLSGGMKRRLMIARALVHEPRLLILDEPTAGVDIELRRSMWSFLRQLNADGTTIILTTHYLEEAESLCRQVAIIDGGEIVVNTQTKTLLQRMNTETFILDIAEPCEAAPAADGYALRKIDLTTLEVDVIKDQGLNQLFSQLMAQGIQVVSMRNKTNRLEELFVSLIEGNGGAATATATATPTKTSNGR